MAESFKEGSLAEKSHVAQVNTTIDAPGAMVWDALVNPAVIKQYMVGTQVASEWKEGSPITWKGEATSVRSQVSPIRPTTITP